MMSAQSHDEEDDLRVVELEPFDDSEGEDDEDEDDGEE